MREIKFRYIVKDEFGELHTVIKTLGQIAHSATERNFERNGCEIVARDEWTGLLDANGREVYEGDVLRYHDNTLVVVWAAGGFNFDFIGKGYTLECNTVTASAAHVIGNIYENPELVE